MSVPLWLKKFAFIAVTLCTWCDVTIAQSDVSLIPASERIGIPQHPEPEAQGDFTLTSSASIYSSYMFRSQNIYDGLSFQPNLQGTLHLGELGDISAIQFLHLPAQGEQYETRYVEIDEGIGYDLTVGKFALSVTHYWYLYPNGNANTFPGSRELIATITWVDKLLNPYITLANEYRAYKVQYYEFGVSHSFNRIFPNKIPLVLFANAGYVTNGKPYWGKDDGFVQSSYGLSMDLEVGPVVITPLLVYANGADPHTTEQWWGGITLSTSL